MTLPLLKGFSKHTSFPFSISLFGFIFITLTTLTLDFFVPLDFGLSWLFKSCSEDCPFEHLWPKKSTASATLALTSGMLSSLRCDGKKVWRYLD